MCHIYLDCTDGCRRYSNNPINQRPAYSWAPVVHWPNAVPHPRAIAMPADRLGYAQQNYSIAIGHILRRMRKNYCHVNSGGPPWSRRSYSIHLELRCLRGKNWQNLVHLNCMILAMTTIASNTFDRATAALTGNLFTTDHIWKWILFVITDLIMIFNQTIFENWTRFRKTKSTALIRSKKE